jgi:hypothetical protein
MDIEVRYEDLPDGGGSIWVRAQSRFCHTPGDTYDDVWTCVWSTSGGNPGRGVPVQNQGFMQVSRPGSQIANPYHQDDPAVGAHALESA